MVDAVSANRFGYRGLFLGLALAVFFVRLLPLSLEPVTWPGPDLLLGLTLAWVLRRPDFVPATVVVAVFLLEDMLLMRPPGLWALLVLLGTEFLRDRAVVLRDIPFVVEWLMVSALVALLLLADRMVLAVAMVPQAGLGLMLAQYLSTVLAYPLVVGLSQFVFGLRKVAPGEVDQLGHRI